MADKAFIRGNAIYSVYDDRFFPVLAALGKVTVTRATNVEFNHASQEWEARLESDGRIIAHGKNRAEVINAEIEFLEDNACHT